MKSVSTTLNKDQLKSTTILGCIVHYYADDKSDDS